MTMTIKEIKEAILAKYPDIYNDTALEGNEKYGMKGMLSEIEEMEPDLRKQLEDFLSKGTRPKYKVGDWSVKRLMKKRGMNEVAALLSLDWLVKEPEKASASLAKGYDFVR